MINRKGKAEQIRVIKTLGLGLEEKAVEAVSKCTFWLGMKDGKPVRVTSVIELNFRLP